MPAAVSQPDDTVYVDLKTTDLRYTKNLHLQKMEEKTHRNKKKGLFLFFTKSFFLLKKRKLLLGSV